MKNYITFLNVNPGGWTGKRSESSSKIPIIDEDGTNLRYIDLEKTGIKGQNTWAACGKLVVNGKKRMVVSSSEGGMGHLPTTRRNMWTYDIETEEIIKIYDIEDRPNYIEFAGQLDNERIIVKEITEENKCSYYSVNIDSNEKKEIEFILPEGYSYGPKLTPDKKHFIIQFANPYSLWKCDVKGGECELLVTDPKGSCFGVGITPDSKWVTFAFFSHDDDPLHEWANVNAVGIEDKKRVRLITDKSYWLTGYNGDETVRGGGSNMMQSAPFGNYVTIVKGLKGSKSAWKIDTSDKADDHFNCVYDKSIAHGGTGISIMDINTKEEIEITKAIEGNWDFRPKWNEETHKLLFIRAKTGERPALWMVDKDGSNQKFITGGYNNVGADHPIWI